MKILSEMKIINEPPVKYNKLSKEITAHEFWKTLTVLILTVLFCMITMQKAQAAATGDYRSAATGNWTTLSTWERYNGTTWVTPSGTNPEGYPGQYAGTGAVDIRAGHTVTIGNTGITTQTIGKLTIYGTGQLYLTGKTSGEIVFDIKTMIVECLSGGVIYFQDKCKLQLPADAVVQLVAGDTSLQGSCSNNQSIYVGSILAVCQGAPGNIFEFSELMAQGGTLNSIPGSNTPLCQGSAINLTGTYSGSIGDPVTYSWSVKAPGGAITTYTTASVTINNAVAGTYEATLSVSTVLEGSTYTNSQTEFVVVIPLPTLSTATQAVIVCDGYQATINLTGLVPSTTFSVDYKINNVAQTQITGLTSDGTGNSSFLTPVLAAANNGQTLQITGLTITVPTTQCPQTFTKDVTLSVQTETWLGTTSTDWHTGSNWCGGSIPTSTTNVIIASTAPNQPKISAAAVCNNISIGSGASLTIEGANTLGVYGNWSNSGTFTPNSSTVTFTGTAAQSISGANNGFYNLIMNKSADALSLSVDITVANTLTFTSGVITTGSYKLILGSAGNAGTVSRISGHVNGNLRRYVPDASNPSVIYCVGDATNYTPITVLFAGTTSGSGYLDASTTVLVAPPATASNLSQTKYVSRKWTITNGGVGGFTSFDPTFTFVPSDILGGGNTSLFVIRKFTAGVWSTTTIGARTGTSTQCTGLTTFSDYYIGEVGRTGIVSNKTTHSK